MRMKCDEVLLVTGASSDIGLQVLRGQLETCPDQKIIAHVGQSGARLQELLSTHSDRLFELQADFSDASARDQLPAQLDALGLMPTKVLHLAAPRLQMKRFKDLSWDDLSLELAVQTASLAVLLQYCLPKMKKAKAGNVVFMLSSNTLGVPASSMSGYTIGKYALLGLMQSLVAEYRGTGIRFNGVSPSMIETGFLRDIPERLVEFAAEGHPLKRNATLDDVVPALEFLLSDASAYLNGVNIPITGGL